MKAESFQTVVEMEAIILVTKRKVGKKKRIMVELLFLIAVFYSPCLDVVMLWMFNNVVLDLCRLMWRHFPYWYRYQNNLNIYRRSSSSMLHRHLSTVARRRQIKLYIQVFCVRPHTLGRPSLRQWSHHHLFFPPASVLILVHNTWMLPCFLSKQG